LLPSTRFEQWRKVKSGECPIVVGPRSALFAPIRNLGVIVVDEEHDHSYKQEQGVRYHAREVALMRARLCGAVVVFGTATPSLDSYYRALKGQWTLLRLTQRVEGKPLPEVRLIDERIASHRRSELLSDPLVDAMGKALSEGRASHFVPEPKGLRPRRHVPEMQLHRSMPQLCSVACLPRNRQHDEMPPLRSPAEI
jgi:primosomal protein N' (replication factor Y)